MDNAVQNTRASIEKEDRHFFDQIPSSLGEVDLRELFRKLWRRKGIIFSTTVFVTILTTIIIFQMVKLYTSSANVLIEPREANVVNLEAVLSGLGGDTETIQSEIEVLKSRQLINKVVGKLKLDRNPEFNVSLRPKGSFGEYLNPINYIPEEWLNALRGDMANEGFSEEDLQIQERAKVIDEVLDKIEVSIKGRSRVISISFTSESPKLAALAPNTLADFYIVEQLEAKFEATKRASKWLQKRVTKLRNKVQDSERAVEVFRKESGLLAGFLGTLTSQQVSELNTQLILARTARAEADARLLQVKELISSVGGG
ncbi:MAG TPA: hypothetical protein ENI79_03980, partial [Rhodospirillales bacterium]|nr:hypothetical protein [Rhodospirillales bacterium]